MVGRFLLFSENNLKKLYNKTRGYDTFIHSYFSRKVLNIITILRGRRETYAIEDWD